MSIVNEFREFSRKMWMEANYERESYGQAGIALDAYMKEYEEFLLDEFHRHKFEK